METQNSRKLLKALVVASLAISLTACSGASIDDVEERDEAGIVGQTENAVGYPVFVNFEGGMYTRGRHDAELNISELVLDGSVDLPPAHAVLDRQGASDCLRELVADYNVAVTTTDPGSVDHIELVVTDSASSLKMESTSSALVPGHYGLGELNDNSIGFVFADAHLNDTDSVCGDLAWGIGKMVGLDNSPECSDVMGIYQKGCGGKRFLDEDVPCGELNSRDCEHEDADGNKNTMQNSHQAMVEAFGD